MIQVVQTFSPKTVKEALEILDGCGAGEIRIVAGGTDLIVQANYQHEEPAPRLLGLQRIEELKFVREEGDRLVIGPSVTHAELLADGLVGRYAPILQESAGQIGAPQIRNRGTVGGNICNSSPVGDLLPSLSVLNARFTVASSSGTKEIPFDSFFTGPRRNVLKPDEILTAVTVEKILPCHRFGFSRIGPRKALAITKASAAYRACLAEGTLTEVNVALGSVGPVVLRARNTERYLEGRPLSPGLLEGIAEAVRSDCTPITDVRSTADYRHHMVGVLLRRMLEKL